MSPDNDKFTYFIPWRKFETWFVDEQVKALFVRAFPKLLSMQYLDCSGKCKIYILDQRKDMFYELEDLR